MSDGVTRWCRTAEFEIFNINGAVTGVSVLQPMSSCRNPAGEMSQNNKIILKFMKSHWVGIAAVATVLMFAGRRMRR
jgi:hypothetical protein